jgi:hypothetical protein
LPGRAHKNFTKKDRHKTVWLDRKGWLWFEFLIDQAKHFHPRKPAQIAHDNQILYSEPLHMKQEFIEPLKVLSKIRRQHRLRQIKKNIRK